MITNINVGLTANDGLGDKLRNAFIIVNDNFDAIDAILTGTNSFTISQIQGLQTALTNINNQIVYIPGLQSDINDINNTIYTINQTLNNQNASIADLYDEITNLQNQIYTKIEEAPIDGVTYGRRDGAWVVVSGGAGTIDLDGVLANGDTSTDKAINMINGSLTISNGSMNNSLAASLILSNGFDASYTEMTSGSLFLKASTPAGGQFLKADPLQNASFVPQFYLPAKSVSGVYRLATTTDYTLQNVTTLANTTNVGIQFQPVLNTGTGSKYVTVANNLVYLFSQSEGYSTITNDKIIWSRFGNVVSLSGWGAAGSNTADYILPTKSPATYTLATTADLYTIASGNTTMLNITGTTARVLYVRGLTNSNGSILLSSTGSNTNANWAWNVSLNPDINYNYLQANTTSTATGAVGRFVWNDTDGTLNLGLKGGNVSLQLGQETVVRVVNKSGATITNGKVVKVIANPGGSNTGIALAQADSDANSATVLGITTEDILNNALGFITIQGLVHDVNTNAFNEGDVLYLSPSTAGGLTNVKPVAPEHMVIVGYVAKKGVADGHILLHVQNGYELNELHNVKITGATAGQVLTYTGTLWENKTPTAGIPFNEVQRISFLKI